MLGILQTFFIHEILNTGIIVHTRIYKINVVKIDVFFSKSEI
jgi:hypothetical protein